MGSTSRTSTTGSYLSREESFDDEGVFDRASNMGSADISAWFQIMPLARLRCNFSCNGCPSFCDCNFSCNGRGSFCDCNFSCRLLDPALGSLSQEGDGRGVQAEKERCASKVDPARGSNLHPDLCVSSRQKAHRRVLTAARGLCPLPRTPPMRNPWPMGRAGCPPRAPRTEGHPAA